MRKMQPSTMIPSAAGRSLKGLERWMGRHKDLLLKISGYGALGYFSYLMLLITLQYIPINFESAFLRIKQNEIIHTHYQWAFYMHVYASIFLLIAGFTQFSKKVRTRFRTFHRSIGKAYVLIILFIASPSGLVMAYHANGGIWSKFSFSILAILWFILTFKALVFVRQQNWEQHRRFMMRSFALTLSAISLRLLKWIIASTLALPPMDTYRFVAWAGWVLNLAVLEMYLLYTTNRSRKLASK